jgi:excisionase family DNA binding protein
MARRTEELPELATPAEARSVLNLSDYQMRALIRERRIAHVMIGSRAMIPRDAVTRFITENTVLPCRAATPAHAFASSTSAVPSTSSGRTPAAAGSAARAQRIAETLKSRSPSSSASAPETTGRVIRATFS